MGIFNKIAGIVNKIGNIQIGTGKIADIFKEKKTIGGKPIVYNAVPFAMGGAAISKGIPTIAKGAKGFLGVAKNFLQRQTTNPLAGVSLKTGLQNIGKRILGGGITGTSLGLAYGISRSITAGENVITAQNIAKSAGLGLSAGISPLGAILGTATGTTEKYMSIPDKIPNFGTPDIPAIPDIPTIPDNYDLSDIMPNINLSAPSSPINMTMPSMSNTPSFSVGGGSAMDTLPLMLLLGGLGIGGYAIARRKKKRKSKKKKYKKRRNS